MLACETSAGMIMHGQGRSQPGPSSVRSAIRTHVRVRQNVQKLGHRGVGLTIPSDDGWCNSGQPAFNQISGAQIESVEGAPGYGQGRRGRAYAITYSDPVRAWRFFHATIQKPYKKAAYGYGKAEEGERRVVSGIRKVPRQG